MGAIYGKRGRGRPKTRHSDNIKVAVGGRRIVELFRLAQDSEMENHGGSF